MKVDLKKEIPTYSARKGRFDVVTVAPAQFLAIDGHGDPNTSPAYAAALSTLYPVAYACTSLSKNEGLCVQTLHVGPYDDEGPILARMHDDVIPSHGLHPAGKHHEIYLGDPHRTAPEKLRTILRQPVARAA